MPLEGEKQKSWKKINEERKAEKRERKKALLIKSAEDAKKADELAKKLNDSSKARPNASTVSIAVPGSILENAQSPELRAYVAGQVARAAAIYRVQEVIVFDDVNTPTLRDMKRSSGDIEGSGDGTVRSSSLQLGRILQYLECPQYLRKFFFPMHKDLAYSGLLNPLDTPHHLRRDSRFMYREGVTCDYKAKEGHTFVNVGLLNEVLVPKALQPGIRVTVKLNLNDSKKKQRATLVSYEEPRRETGVYWGYQVRIAHTLSEVFSKCPYDGGYDVTVGTSDRGTNVQDMPRESIEYNHLLMVFGGLQGLEEAIANDDKLVSISEADTLFDHYLNVLPKQGSRTIRTEEALLIALAAVQEKLKPKVEDLVFDLSEYLPASKDTGITVGRNQLVGLKKREKRLHEEQVANHEPTSAEQTTEECTAQKRSKRMGLSPPKEQAVKKPKPFVDDVDFEIVSSDQPISAAPVNASLIDDDLSRFD